MGGADQATLLDAKGVAKSFGAVRALTDARLHVAAGEVVALMGANGAGKSTFVKILTGALRPDAGRVLIRGEVARTGSPAQARRSGLVPVYQEPSLIPDLDVADNLRLGGIASDAVLHWVEALGIKGLRLRDMISDLPLATLRILDLARALASKPDVLLLDEMTAALPTDLVENVLRVVRGQADEGRGVIYISHRFTEIADLCDSATVLRDGRTVGEVKIEPGVEDRCVEMMLGTTLSLSARETSAARVSAGVPQLRARNIAVAPKVIDVSFDLHPGEVLGVVALEGQGQDEVFEVLSGHRKPSSGTIEVHGAPCKFGHPADAIAAGLGYVPGDRAEALLRERSVRENIALPFSARLRDWGPLKSRHERRRVDHAIEKLQIDTRAQGEVQRLSGGNQQKVTIGRWLAHGVQTLLLFDPTRGIDVRTKRQIYPLVRELAEEQGAAVLFYTSELEEIALACDRAIVIFNGRVVDTIPAADATQEVLMRAAYGLTDESATS